MKTFISVSAFAFLVAASTIAAPLPVSLVGKWNRAITFDISPNGVPLSAKITWAKKGANLVETIKAPGQTTTITYSKNGTATYSYRGKGTRIDQTGTWTIKGKKLTVSTQSKAVVTGPGDDIGGYMESRQTFFTQSITIKKKSVTGTSETYAMVTSWYANDNPIVVDTYKDSDWIKIGFKETPK